MAATDQPVAAPAQRPRAAAAHRAGRSSWCCWRSPRVLVTGALVLVEANQEQELRPALFCVGRPTSALFTGRALRGAPVRARTPTR